MEKYQIQDKTLQQKHILGENGIAKLFFLTFSLPVTCGFVDKVWQSNRHRSICE